MLVIKKTPVYITRELCNAAGVNYEEKIFGCAALDGFDICGFSLFEIDRKNVLITYAKSHEKGVLDGVVRAAIALGEDMGAETYSFSVDDETADALLPLGFRNKGTSPGDIKNLFSACNGCKRAQEEK